jgi:hypothetical protein
MSFSASLELSVQAFASAIVKPAALADSNAPFQPPRFVLPDLLSIIDPAFEYATSPHQNAAEAAGRTWLLQYAWIVSYTRCMLLIVLCLQVQGGTRGHAE